MKVIETKLKINSDGVLVEWNNSLRRWESTFKTWSWDDIHPDYLEESKENWDMYQESLTDEA